MSREHRKADRLQHKKTSTGFLLVLSAPSGGGKTTILNRLLETNDPDYRYSISATTRQPRTDEVDGEDYFFISDTEFQKCVAENRFIEHALVHGKNYGTPRDKIEHWINQGKIVLMDLDVQGGINVKNQLGMKAVLVFIMPPSIESLRARLSQRNTDTAEEIEERLEAAVKEMAIADQYDYQVVNHKIDETVEEVKAIIDRRRF